MNFLKNRDCIRGLSVMTSLGCNLNCEYCHIAQSVNPNSKNLQAATMTALQDGTYLKNMEKVLERLEQSPYGIDSIAFWGQEPTLTLHLITEHLEDWLTMFPNWRHCSFSTNTMAHTERIADFVKKFDSLVDHPVDISVQLSYDGEYSTNTLRGGSDSIIYKNVMTLIESLNGYEFKHIDLSLNFHGVISFDLLSKLKTLEAIREYSKGLGEWTMNFYHKNTNNHVRFSHAGVDLSLETPYNGGVQEGLDVAHFCRMANHLNVEDVYPLQIKAGIETPLLPQEYLYVFGDVCLDRIVRACIEDVGAHSFEEALANISHDMAAKERFLTSLSDVPYCGNGVHELKIMYDGTLINCQNHIYDTDVQYLPEATDIKSGTRRALATHHYFANALTDSDEILERYFMLFNSCKHSSLDFMWQTNITTMMFLAETNQIDKSYHDPIKLIKHALIAAMLNCCSYNNQVMTGSIFLRHPGFIRILCNGYLDEIIQAFSNRSLRGGFEL